MKIFLTGGTGLIGKHFIDTYHSEHHFTVLSRSPENAKKQLSSSVSIVNQLNDIEDIGEFDAVINLAGEPIADKRWTKKQKRIICESRWDTTSTLVDKINQSANPPSVFLSGSAIGYYGRQGDAEVVETTTPHKEFTHDVCVKWEAIANTIDSSKTRLCILRTGVVLASEGGALDKMALPFKLGLGGKIGSGKQYLSWIHIDDMVQAMMHLLTHDDTRGNFNFTAPQPVTNSEFSSALARALKRPCLFTVPRITMKLAMGESADMILEGQKVVPQRLLASGYQFSYPNVDGALCAIYSK